MLLNEKQTVLENEMCGNTLYTPKKAQHKIKNMFM